MDCINLKKRFGVRYRITFDPAYDPRGRPQEKLDHSMMVIEGQRRQLPQLAAGHRAPLDFDS